MAILIPPLRARREDIFELAQFLLRRSAARLRLPAPTISEEARQVLYQNDWPGNVRELEHCLERALILSRSGVIMPEHVKLASGPAPADPLDAFSLEDGLHGAVRTLERRLIERALTAAAGNRTRAAQLLKINRRPSMTSFVSTASSRNCRMKSDEACCFILYLATIRKGTRCFAIAWAEDPAAMISST